VFLGEEVNPMRYRERYDLTKNKDRIRLAKILLSEVIEFKTKSIKLEFVD
jgi:hypothetical protein